jgi:hypothetical protein
MREEAFAELRNFLIIFEKIAKSHIEIISIYGDFVWLRILL